jgi:DNA-binding XRE family transcriptional regulator
MNQIKATRTRLAITQEEMADRLGISTRQLQRLEAGANVKRPIRLALMMIERNG